MRKVAAVSLGVFSVVVVGGWTISWYLQASETKKAIENAFAKVNAEQQYITYQSIETSGFPSNVNVSIVKPRFSGRVDQLLKKLMANTNPEPNSELAHQKAMFDALPEWTEDVLLDGKIVFSVNALSNHYGLTFSGNWDQRGTIGIHKVSMKSESKGDTVCQMEMASGGIFGTLWNFKDFAKDGKQFLTDFRLLDCNASGYTATDRVNPKILMSSGPARIYITNTPRGATRDIRVMFTAQDSEMTEEMDKVMAIYFKAISPDYPFPPQFALYGKQNMSFDFTYAGPSDLETAGKDAAFDIRLSKFELKNQVYDYSMAFQASNAVNNGTRNAKLTFNAVSNFSEQYNNMLKIMVRGVIDEMYRSKDPELMEAQAFLKRYTPEQMYAIVYPSIPDFHSLGKMTQALDISYQGNADFTAGDVSMPNLEFSATPYGITGKGTARTAQNQMFPAANVALRCANCPQMIDDIVAYAGKLQKTVAYFDPDSAQSMSINPQLVSGIKSFLAALSEPSKDNASNTTYHYTVVSDGGMNVTISGKTMDQVMGLFQQHLASYVPNEGGGIAMESVTPPLPHQNPEQNFMGQGYTGAPHMEKFQGIPAIPHIPPPTQPVH